MDMLSFPASFSPAQLAAKPSFPIRRSPETAAVRRPIVPSNLQTPDNPKNPPASNPLSSKLWLSSKLSPPPPPPPPPPVESLESKIHPKDPDPPPPAQPQEFRQKGQIFVGNLPKWIKKKEVVDFFRQFGPLKDVVLIRDHEDQERNMGYCFVIYGGPTADESAEQAVEFDGVEFHGKVLTVRMDDGSRLKARAEERARWAAGNDKREFRSQWHEENDIACRKFRKVLETEPKNWQAVINAFKSIPKPSRGEYGLMVNYYARRGDKHHARSTFEEMRAKGIEANSYVFTNRQRYAGCTLLC